MRTCRTPDVDDTISIATGCVLAIRRETRCGYLGCVRAKHAALNRPRLSQHPSTLHGSPAIGMSQTDIYIPVVHLCEYWPIVGTSTRKLMVTYLLDPYSCALYAQDMNLVYRCMTCLPRSNRSACPCSFALALKRPYASV